MTGAHETCRLCGASAAPAGIARGRRTGRDFALARCTGCGFAWIVAPWTEYATIYDERYYRGEGSDPSVDYAFEYERPDATVRRAEWAGITADVLALDPGVRRWLDVGCGNGGLVRHIRSSHPSIEATGWDTGAWARRARGDGLPILDEAELDAAVGTYDVVTAIEVIEHVVDPVPFLQSIRRMLRPGGLFFYTTGNAARAPSELPRWSYVAPEIHVSYFTPEAMRLALTAAGFEPVSRGKLPGDRGILRYKILKGLGQKRTRPWHAFVPWPLLAAWFHRRQGLGDMPLGRAIATP